MLLSHTIKMLLISVQEDSLVNHIAAKIVENVATTKGQVVLKFVTTEMAQSLWYIFKHSTLDAVRVTALSVSMTGEALCCNIFIHPANQVFVSYIASIHSNCPYFS